MLERVAGRRLQFAVRLHDGGRLVASRRITGVVAGHRLLPAGDNGPDRSQWFAVVWAQ